MSSLLPDIPFTANDARLSGLYAMLTDENQPVRLQGLELLREVAAAGEVYVRDGWASVGLCFVRLTDGAAVWLEMEHAGDPESCMYLYYLRDLAADTDSLSSNVPAICTATRFFPPMRGRKPTPPTGETTGRTP